MNTLLFFGKRQGLRFAQAATGASPLETLRAYGMAGPILLWMLFMTRRSFLVNILRLEIYNGMR